MAKKTHQLLIRFEPADRERIEAWATREGRPAAQLARKILLDAVDAEERRAGPIRVVPDLYPETEPPFLQVAESAPKKPKGVP